jgi:hypothetical protein
MVGAEWNQEILQRRPHVLLEDLAVTFHIDMGTNAEGAMSVPIHNDLMASWGVTAEDLYELAVKNLTDSEDGFFKSMNDVMREMMLSDILEECDGDREAAEQMLDTMMIPDNSMFVLTKKDKHHGASEILNKRLMQTVIDQVGKDFYILPSSIHELLVVPADADLNPEELVTMVKEVNQTKVDEQDRLSDHVYRYTLEEGLKIA